MKTAVLTRAFVTILCAAASLFPSYSLAGDTFAKIGKGRDFLICADGTSSALKGVLRKGAYQKRSRRLLSRPLLARYTRSCKRGPASYMSSLSGSDSCRAADLDNDGEVSLADLGLLQKRRRNLSGNNRFDKADLKFSLRCLGSAKRPKSSSSKYRSSSSQISSVSSSSSSNSSIPSSQSSLSSSSSSRSVTGDVNPVISASRTSCVVPCAINFDQPGPTEHEYSWNFGDGQTANGFQAAHIYEEPGTYTVTLEEQDLKSGGYGLVRAEIRALPFAGRTFYVDASAGNDNNTGLSPALAWASAVKVDSFIRSLPIAERKDLRFLFKRGETFFIPADAYALINLVHVPGPLRFGAYQRADGSDDPARPKPILSDHPSRGIGSADAVLLQTFADVHDVVFQDLHLQGNYRYLTPEEHASDCRNRANYRTFGFGINGFSDKGQDTSNIALLRVEANNLLSGSWSEGIVNHVFIHDSYIHHIQSCPVYGQVEWYSLQNNAIEYSSSCHLHYLDPRHGVIRKNRFRGSGISVDCGRPGVLWYSAGLRIETGIGGPHRDYVAENEIRDAYFYPLYIISNYPDTPTPSDIVVEKNYIEGINHAGFCTEIFIKPVENLTIRNNLIYYPCKSYSGAIRLSGYDTERRFSNVNIYNNSIYSAQGADLGVITIGELMQTSHDIRIKNNIFYGLFNYALWSDGTLVPGFDADYNLYYRSDGQPAAFRVNGSAVPYREWQTSYDKNSLNALAPGLMSLDPESPSFLKLNPDSPAIDAGGFASALDDFAGLPRFADGPDADSVPQCDIGAFEYQR